MSQLARLQNSASRYHVGEIRESACNTIHVPLVVLTLDEVTLNRTSSRVACSNCSSLLEAMCLYSILLVLSLLAVLQERLVAWNLSMACSFSVSVASHAASRSAFTDAGS